MQQSKHISGAWRIPTHAETMAHIDAIAAESERLKADLAGSWIMHKFLGQCRERLRLDKPGLKEFIEFRDLDKLGWEPTAETLNDPDIRPVLRVLFKKAQEQNAKAGLKINQSKTNFVKRRRIQKMRDTLAAMPLKLEHVRKMADHEGFDASKLDEAVGAIIQGNGRYVMKVARAFARSNPAIDFDDYLQEGLLGLSRAAVLFRSRGGFKFLTYARSHVVGAMQNLQRVKQQTIRIPHHTIDLVLRYRKLASAVPAPTDAELMKELNIDEHKLRDLRDWSSGMNVASLDAPLNTSNGDDEVFSLADIVADDKAVMPDDLMMDAERNGFVRQIMADALNEREQQVMRMRFGIGDDSAGPCQHGEIANALGVTKQRVSQMERECRLKLRRHVAEAGIVVQF